jgi:acetyltransferase
MSTDIALRSPAARPRAPYPAHLVEQTRLTDGTPVTIRPIRAGDLPLERAFVVGLSPHTRYQRLLSGRKLLPGELRRLTDIDYARELALIALARFEGREHMLGVARYVRDDSTDDASCDFAIVVADRWQGHGLGEALLRRLLRAARADGIAVVGGITLSTNAAMIGLARKFGFRALREAGNASVTELRWQAGDLPAEPILHS